MMRLKVRKAFANGSLANIKLSKTALPKMVQLGRFLSRLIGPLLKTGLPLTLFRMGGKKIPTSFPL